MVLDGPMVTKYEMRIAHSLDDNSVSPDGDGDGDGEEDRLDDGGGVPMVAFSEIIQPSPTTIGPS